ncbi:MAG: MoxR family ATPase [Planctomycetota bacterium]
MSRLTVEQIQTGALYETTFYPNAVAGSGFRFRATHLDGKKSPKVILCDDSRIVSGAPCQVRVQSIKKPARDDRGSIVVDWVQNLEFRMEGVYLDPAVSKKLQVLLESGLNILLDGPQGCGKTVTARSIANSLGMQFVFFNCGAVIDASDFLASIQVRASSTGAPVTDFVKTEVLEALESALATPAQRYLIFLDELNRCPESARNALMPALDTSRRLFHPIENRFIEIGDNVQFIAAVNQGSEFSATFGIDAAQLDRFAPVQMDYLPPEAEVKLLSERHPEVSQAVLNRLVALANRVRQSSEVAGGLSVRATDEACVYLKHPLYADQPHKAMDEILQSSFCGRFTGRWSDVTTEAGAVWALLKRSIRDEKLGG